MARSSRAGAIAHPGWPPVQARRRNSRSLSHRILLESVLLAIITALTLGFVFGVQNSSISFASSQGFSYGIDPGRDPVQRETRFFQTALPVDGGVATLTSDTSYSISARAESTLAYGDSISTAIPYDVLLSWGRMADDDVDSKLEWQQGDRQGTVSGTLGGASGPDVSTEYVINHVSNSHLVPANGSIRAALATIKPGDLVKIDGRLVDVRMVTNDNRVLTVKTSKSRSDQGDGACEIIFVERIKINDRSYK